MNSAAAYLHYVRALITLNRQVAGWRVLREETQGNEGLYRYRLLLSDGGMLEMFERLSVSEGKVQSGKYSFHWQDSSGSLNKRWDNAPHQPGLPTFPSHVHDRSETNVQAHEPCQPKRCCNS